MMNLKKIIKESLGINLSESPSKLGVQEEPRYELGKVPKNKRFKVVWFGDFDFCILEDLQSKDLYVFSYEMIDEKDFKKYADLKIYDTFQGYDEDGFPDVDSEEFWELDGGVIENYINDNFQNLSKGKGLESYENGDELVLIDYTLKPELLDTAQKYVKNNKDELIKILNNLTFEDDIENNITESKKEFDKEVFVKIIFGLKNISSDKIKELNDINNQNFGERISKRDGSEFWSTYIPKAIAKDFMNQTKYYKPILGDEEILSSRIKPLTKNLEDNQEITFLDYTVSQNNPPKKKGYLKPGFIRRNRSMLKWDNDSKEAYIENDLIDKNYFYHGDITDNQDLDRSSSVDSSNVKVFFDDEILNNMNAYDASRLREIIKQHKGQLRYVFGSERASGGQRYTIVPIELADDFIQAAYDFGAYDAETERNLKLEDNSLNEIRKIVRSEINKIIK